MKPSPVYYTRDANGRLSALEAGTESDAYAKALLLSHVRGTAIDVCVSDGDPTDSRNTTARLVARATQGRVVPASLDRDKENADLRRENEELKAQLAKKGG
jgi:hypothetical protein